MALLTLGTHAQRGLLYLVCVSVMAPRVCTLVLSIFSNTSITDLSRTRKPGISCQTCPNPSQLEPRQFVLSHTPVQKAATTIVEKDVLREF